VSRLKAGGEEPVGPRPCTRRQAMRYAAMAAGAVGLAGAVGAAVPAEAAPVRGSGVVTVVWNPISSYWQFPTNTVIQLINENVVPAFERQHPGIRLQSAGPMINTSTTTSAILAGTAPDVFNDNTVAPYIEGNLALNLTPYMQQDNVNPNLFATSQIAKYTSNGNIYMLPSYIGTTVLIVNKSILGQLGLTPPAGGEVGASYQEWTSIFRAAAGNVKGQRRYGTSIFNGINPFYFHGFGSSVVSETDPTQPGFDNPGGVAAVEWMMNLLWDNVAIYNGGGQANTIQLFSKGLTVAPVCWIQMLPHWVPVLEGMDWDFYQMPLWPAQPATFANTDFWAISASTKVPDAAWELLKFITTGGQYSELLMHTALFPPNLKSLWPQWVSTVQNVAPPLRGKNLEAFAQYVLTDHAYPGRDFAYGNSQAHSIFGSYLGKIQAKQLDVQLGLHQAAQQIVAFENQAKQLQAVQNQVQREDAALSLSLFPRPVISLRP
jgi:ABC-type glycerol-3-phosphate transport system substrate-binding protein